MEASQEIAQIFGLAGKTSLVTGAATGIGREIAKLYHKAGAKVIAADINTAGIRSLEAELGDRIEAIEADMAAPASIAALFGRIETLDVLVNCAAIYPMKKFEEVDVPFLDRMIDINLRGVFLCIQQAMPIMKRGGGGSIVNISSVNSLKACIYDNAHYGITKAGLNSLTSTIALEYGNSGSA